MASERQVRLDALLDRVEVQLLELARSPTARTRHRRSPPTAGRATTPGRTQRLGGPRRARLLPAPDVPPRSRGGSDQGQARRLDPQQVPTPTRHPAALAATPRTARVQPNLLRGDRAPCAGARCAPATPSVRPAAVARPTPRRSADRPRRPRQRATASTASTARCFSPPELDAATTVADLQRAENPIVHSPSGGTYHRSPSPDKSGADSDCHRFVGGLSPAALTLSGARSQRSSETGRSR